MDIRYHIGLTKECICSTNITLLPLEEPLIGPVCVPRCPEEEILDRQTECFVNHGTLQSGQTGTPSAAQDLDGVSRVITHEVEGLK